jgi:hypothetical protein
VLLKSLTTALIVRTKQQHSAQAAGYSATWCIHTVLPSQARATSKARPHKAEHATQHATALYPAGFSVCALPCVAHRHPTHIHDMKSPHSSPTHAPLATHSTHNAADQSWRKDQRTRTRPRLGECLVGCFDTLATVLTALTGCCGFSWCCVATAVGLLLLSFLGRLKQAACGLWNLLRLLTRVSCFLSSLTKPHQLLPPAWLCTGDGF